MTLSRICSKERKDKSTAWIESHQSLGRHPKVLRLSVKLRIHKAQVIGHLKYLWWWALDYAPKGDLSAFSSAEISNAAEWPGDAETFHKNLKEVGWIDHDNTLHDWGEYAGPYLKSLRRQKRYRDRNKKLRNTNVTVTATEQNSTLPDSTKPLTLGNGPSAPPNGKDIDHFLIDDIVEYCHDEKSRGNFIALYKKHGEELLRQAFGEMKSKVNEGSSIANPGAYVTQLLKNWSSS